MNLAMNPVQRAAVPAPRGAVGTAHGFGRGCVGSTWAFDGPCAKSIGLERGDSAP